MVLLMTTLLADNHQIVKDEYCSTMSMEIWTFSFQVQDFIDTELQNKMTLRGGEFLKGGRKRKMEEAVADAGFLEGGFCYSIACEVRV